MSNNPINGVRLEAAEYQEEAQLQQEAQLQKGEAPGIVIPVWRTNDWDWIFWWRAPYLDNVYNAIYI